MPEAQPSMSRLVSEVGNASRVREKDPERFVRAVAAYDALKIQTAIEKHRSTLDAATRTRLAALLTEVEQ